MGSDPQSHLEAQNVLIVGKKKISQDDWKEYILRLQAIHRMLITIDNQIPPSVDMIHYATREVDALLLSMRHRTGV